MKHVSLTDGYISGQFDNLHSSKFSQCREASSLTHHLPSEDLYFLLLLPFLPSKLMLHSKVCLPGLKVGYEMERCQIGLHPWSAWV